MNLHDRYFGKDELNSRKKHLADINNLIGYLTGLPMKSSAITKRLKILRSMKKVSEKSLKAYICERETYLEGLSK